MTGTIILDSNNLNQNGVFDATTTKAPFNRFTVNLRGINLTGRKIGLRKLYMYYSWANINNATPITISWKIGGAFTNYTWTLPALGNISSIAMLNESLQNFCITNGLYLMDKATPANNVYFLEFVANASSYKVELNLFKVPTSAGTDYVAPSNFAGYPTVSCTPKLTIPSGSELCNLIGFADGTYDGDTTATQFTSTFVPQLSSVSNIFITCNIAKNDVPINGSTVIGSFNTRGVDYGGMIVIDSQTIDWYEIDTNSNLLEIQFWDQNWNKLYVQDPQTMIQLQIQ